MRSASWKIVLTCASRRSWERMKTKNPSGPCFFLEHLWIVIYALMLVIMGATIECQMMMMIRRIEINERRSDTLFIKSFIIRKK